MMLTKKLNKEVLAWGQAFIMGALTFLTQQYAPEEEQIAEKNISVTDKGRPKGYPLIEVTEDYSDTSIMLDNSFKP